MSKANCQGLVLRKINYSDTSLVVKILTKESGLKSFLFPGAKRKNKKGNILQPLTLVNVEYYQRADSDLPKISQVDTKHVYKTIPFDPYKSSVVFFMTEIIQKTIHEDESDDELYDFLENALLILDESDSIANFPLKFLLWYPQYLGFSLQPEKDAEYFDYQEAIFVRNKPNHPFHLNQYKTGILKELSGMNFDGNNDPKLDLITRRELVYDLLKVYQVFFDNFREVQSLAILEASLH